MSRIVEIVGGPRDGEIITVGDTDRIRFPIARSVTVSEATGHPCLDTLTVPIRRTKLGWRAYWSEGT